MTRSHSVTLRGQGVQPGIAIGRTVYLERTDHEIFRDTLAPEAVDAEVERFHQALEKTRQEIERTRERVREQIDGNLAEIFEAHRLILLDDMFVGHVVDRIRQERVNAEWAVHETSHELQELFARIETEHLSERSDDLRDVTRYLVRTLQGLHYHEADQVPRGAIVVAHQLTPSEALRLGRMGVVGLALEGGGATSHTTIVARALGIPLIAGLGDVVSGAVERDVAILDAHEGVLILDPADDLLTQYRTRRNQQERYRQGADRELYDLPATTLDGVEVELLANVELPEEMAEVLRQNAGGIGLYRSEFLFIERSPDLPSEEEHYTVFRNLLTAMAPKPVVVRTFDLGGRKLAGELLATWEENPNLGLRGIRLTLVRPQIFRSQLRALYRAARHGNLKIMVPMVSNLEEVRAFKALCRSVMDELASEHQGPFPEVPLGAMIEVPAAALLTKHLARELDFLAIGTNDLIQYTLAVDRSNEHVSGLYQPLHPAIIELLFHIVDQATDEAELSICGEMASNPDFVPLLLMAGLRRLSMSPGAIAGVKRAIRGFDLDQARGLIPRMRAASTAAEVSAILSELPQVAEQAHRPRGLG
jgi:phosphotransferase system enzyme I (PtsI)